MSLYESILKQRISNAELEEIISKIEKGEDLLFNSEDELTDSDTLDMSDMETLNELYKIAEDKLQTLMEKKEDYRENSIFKSSIIKNFTLLKTFIVFIAATILLWVLRQNNWAITEGNFPFHKIINKYLSFSGHSQHNISFKGDLNQVERSFYTYHLKIEDRLSNMEKQFENELHEQVTIIHENLTELNNFKTRIEAQMKTIQDNFITSNLPQYIPAFKLENGSLEIIPELQNYLKSAILESLTNSLLYNDTKNSFQSTKQLYQKYLNDYFLQYNNTVLVNLRSSITNDIFKKLDYDSIASKLSEKISPEKLVIDSATELGLTSLIRKVLKAKDNDDHYNFATYENGARIIPELVSSFDSFNITTLFLNQYNELNSLHRKICNFITLGLLCNSKISPISRNRKYQDNLVLIAYQAILPTVLPKDTLLQELDSNEQPIQTGVKTFGIKLPYPVYLSDIFISYPKYLDSASTVFSAPKKIAIWIRLTKFENDFDKLQKYLYNKTKNRYSYVLNLEKLKDDTSKVGNNEIPMKRMKTDDEIAYEKFYESNFNLFENQFIKIGNMIYDQRTDDSEQAFELLDDSFKSLKVQVDSLFFSIESNYGNDKFATNLFRVKVHGVSEFDLYCMNQLLSSEEGANDYHSINKDDLINLERLFNKKFIKNVDFVSDENYSSNDDESANRIIMDDNNIDYF